MYLWKNKKKDTHFESVKVEAGVEVRKDERRQGMICVSLDVEAVAIRVGEEDRLKRVGKQEERR